MEGTKRFSAQHHPGEPVERTVRSALAAASEFAKGCRLDPLSAARLALCVDELVGNLLHHGEAPCEVRIALAMTRSEGAVEMVLEDNCLPFDPREVAFGGPDEETGGGVGLALVRGLAQIVAYERADGVNRLTLRVDTT
jgi:serine/threonine-protein kinase RsbW